MASLDRLDNAERLYRQANSAYAAGAIRMAGEHIFHAKTALAGWLKDEAPDAFGKPRPIYEEASDFMDEVVSLGELIAAAAAPAEAVAA